MTSSPPRISVIMPVKNGQATLQEAIDSVLNQTASDFELLIIDDGSKDASQAIAQQNARKDSRIRALSTTNLTLIDSGANVSATKPGIVSALNFGLSQARGEFIARLDADDSAMPTRFDIQLKALENNLNLAVVGSFYREISDSGREITPTCPLPVGVEVIRNHLWSVGNAICHPSVMIRATAIKAVGGYREQFSLAEDYDLWLRISERYSLDNIPEVLTSYRRHTQSVSTKNLEKQMFISIAARTSAEIRRHHHFDPVTFASRYPPAGLSTKHLLDWGITSRALAGEMIAWLEYNRERLALYSGDTAAVRLIHIELDQAIDRYKAMKESLVSSIFINTSEIFTVVIPLNRLALCNDYRRLVNWLINSARSALRRPNVAHVRIACSWYSLKSRLIFAQAKKALKNDSRLNLVQMNIPTGHKADGDESQKSSEAKTNKRTIVLPLGEVLDFDFSLSSTDQE